MAVLNDQKGDDFEPSEQDLSLMEALQGAEDVYVTDAIEAILDFRMSEDAPSANVMPDDSTD